MKFDEGQATGVNGECVNGLDAGVNRDEGGRNILQSISFVCVLCTSLQLLQLCNSELLQFLRRPPGEMYHV